MICPEQVWLAVVPVDMRWGMDRLSAYVQHVIGRTPCDGTVYVFTNRDRSRLKLLAWDGNGCVPQRMAAIAGTSKNPAPATHDKIPSS